MSTRQISRSKLPTKRPHGTRAKASAWRQQPRWQRCLTHKVGAGFVAALAIGGALVTFTALSKPAASLTSSLNQATKQIPQLAATAPVANPGEGILTDNNKAGSWGAWSDDAYWRGCWNTIESSQAGVYNYASLDNALALARSQGGKMGIRIMSYMPNGSGNNVCLPAYLSSVGDPPNWNSSTYLTAAHNLINALGARYNNNPAFGWVEVSPYGCWSEWNFSCVPSGRSKTPMTAANKQSLIQWWRQAFPNKRVMMMLGGGTNSDGSGYDALSYALNLSPSIGWRQDCLGNSALDYYYTVMSSVAKSRWQTAPLIFEYCGNPSLSLAQTQIQKYHPATLGDGYGNILPPVTSALQSNFATAGFRFVPQTVTVSSSTLAAGSAFTVSTSWSNEGVTPAYDPWNAWLELKNSASGAVAWQGELALNFDQFMPGTKSVTGSFTVPSSVPAGSYELALVVKDPAGYYKPMQLAIQGRQSDGSYSLASISVTQSGGGSSGTGAGGGSPDTSAGGSAQSSGSSTTPSSSNQTVSGPVSGRSTSGQASPTLSSSSTSSGPQNLTAFQVVGKFIRTEFEEGRIGAVSLVCAALALASGVLIAIKLKRRPAVIANNPQPSTDSVVYVSPTFEPPRYGLHAWLRLFLERLRRG